MKKALILMAMFSLVVLNCSKKTITNNYYTYPSAESAIVGIVFPAESKATVTACIAIPVASTEIDTNGYFKISGLPAGTYSLLVQADGYIDYSTKSYIRLSGNETAVVDTIYLVSIHDLVLSVSPFDGQQDVRTGDRIRIAFRKPMNRASVEAAFNIEPGVPGEFTWLPSYDLLQFTPGEHLAISTLYQVTIETTASDTEGIKLAEPYRFSFTTEGIRVEYHSPQHNSTDVPTDASVYVRFNTGMNTESVISAFRMVDSRLNDVNGEFVLVTNDRFTFYPDSRLALEETYTVTIGATATDTAGNQLTTPFSFSFTTAAVKVTYHFPYDGEVAVNTAVAVRIIFSTAMETESAESSFDMVDSQLNQVVGSLIWESSTEMNFVPYAFLAAEETYTVSVDTTAYDTQGNKMSKACRFSFTTQPIMIESTSPKHKASWVSPAVTIGVLFNTDMDMQSVNSAFKMVDSQDNQITGSFIWEFPHRVQFQPQGTLAYDEFYTVTISTEAADMHGRNLKDPFTFWFKTYPAP